MRTKTFILMTAMLLFSACSESDTPTSGQQDAMSATINAIALSSAEGADLTKRQCASCHSLDRNIRKIGPTLKGIMGRAPSVEGIPFEKWDEVTMDKWLENPRAVKQKTRMAIPGISDPEERKTIIAYLKLI